MQAINLVVVLYLRVMQFCQLCGLCYLILLNTLSKLFSSLGEKENKSNN